MKINKFTSSLDLYYQRCLTTKAMNPLYSEDVVCMVMGVGIGVGGDGMGWYEGGHSNPILYAALVACV